MEVDPDPVAGPVPVYSEATASAADPILPT